MLHYSIVVAVFKRQGVWAHPALNSRAQNKLCYYTPEYLSSIASSGLGLLSDCAFTSLFCHFAVYHDGRSQYVRRDFFYEQSVMDDD
jgi:hypothetical protein